MERWQFIQSPAGGWYWLCSDVISRKTRTSTGVFDSRAECMANAMGHGYPRAVSASPRTEGKRMARHRRNKAR
jgi:hypothetical protein